MELELKSTSKKECRNYFHGRIRLRIEKSENMLKNMDKAWGEEELSVVAVQKKVF